MRYWLFLLFIILSSISLLGSKSHLAQLDSLFRNQRKEILPQSIDSLYQLNIENKKNQIKILEQAITELIRLDKYDFALKYTHLGIDITKGTDYDSAHANFLKQIGSVEYYQKNLPLAIEAFETTLKFAQSKQIIAIEASCNNNIGGILIEQKNFAKAEEYLKRSIFLSEQIVGGTRNLIMSKRLLATLYTRTGEVKKAFELYESNLKLAQELKDTTMICANLVYYAELLLELNYKQEALVKSEQAIALTRKLNNSNSLKAALASHSHVLLKLKRFEDLAAVYGEMIGLQGIIYSEDTQKQVNELETKFKVKNIEQDKLLLKNENELKKAELIQAKAEKQFQSLLFLGVLLIFILIGFGYYYWKKNKEKIQQAQFKRQELESIIETQESERIRIAKELHDGVVQDLTVLKFKIMAIENEQNSLLFSSLNEFGESISSTINEVREISYQMMPIALRANGLVDAIHELLERSFSAINIKYDYTHFSKENRYNDKIEISLYRICQVLINNIIKHSEATNVVLILRSTVKHLLLIVEDNGIGFKVDQVKKGIGLQSLNSRVEMINGSLKINSSTQQGTTFQIRVPLT